MISSGHRTGIEPLHGIAHSVAVAQDLAVGIHAVVGYRNYACIKRHGCFVAAVRDDEPVKTKLDITLADEVAGIFIVDELTFQIAAVWNGSASKLLGVRERAQYRVADLIGLRRKLGFGDGALDDGARGQHGSGGKGLG